MKRKYLFISLALFLLGVILNFGYNRYAGSNKIFEVNMADIIGGLMLPPTFILLYMGYTRRKSINLPLTVVYGVATYIGYKLLDSISALEMSDYCAMIAAVISGILTYAILKLCIKKG